eukprot:GHVQ01033228.1.p1 GENE.GHVQ01033228.1~~GHVQ01033228.1.p1  ORF type:complete len:260 (-),score=40.24 GHVQ01033228.1:293-1072(-)
MTELIEQTISCTKEQTANVNTLQSIACRLLQHRFPPVTMSCILQLPVQYSSTLSSVAHSPELAAPGGSGGASEAPRPLSSSAFGGMRSDAACHVDSFNGHNNPASQAMSDVHIGKIPRPASSVPAAARAKPPKVPQIPKVSLEELNSIPMYQRRGLTLEKLNRAANDIQQFMTKKYKILNASPAKLSPEQYKMLKAYKEQETPLTKHCLIFSIADLKHFEFLKNDTTSKAIVAALRVLGRLDTIADGGQLFYSVPATPA